MNPHDLEALTQQNALSLLWAVSGVMFGGPLGYGAAYVLGRRWRLRGTHAALVGGAVGLALAALLMLWLRNAGAAYAFALLIGASFGGRAAGHANGYRRRRTRVRAARRAAGRDGATHGDGDAPASP